MVFHVNQAESADMGYLVSIDFMCYMCDMILMSIVFTILESCELPFFLILLVPKGFV